MHQPASNREARREMRRQKALAEVRRAAAAWGTDYLTIAMFEERADMCKQTVIEAFGSWNQAVAAAGLNPNPPGGQTLHVRRGPTEADLLGEIIRVTEALGKKPSQAAFMANARFSVWPYKKRWETFDAACREAYARQKTEGALKEVTP